MTIVELLRKLGIFRSGSVAATYTNAVERPSELQMEGVFNAEKDLVHLDAKAAPPAQTTPPPATPTPDTPAPAPPTPKPTDSAKNTMALIGLIAAFFVPLAGLALSIIGFVKANKPGGAGKGLAIAGIVTSLIVGLLQLVFFTGIIIALVSGSDLELTEYTDPTYQYTVRYPEEWEKKTEKIDTVDSVSFEDEFGETGKVTGRVEVVHTPPPPAGQELKSDALQIFRDELKNQNTNTIVEFETVTTHKGNSALRMITTYKSETGKIKAKTTIIRMADSTMYIVSTQAPIDNYDDYSDSFDEIHTTFTP